jgi:Ca2+/Na+ antiporter
MNFSDILSSGSGIPIGAAGVLLSIILYFFYLKNLSDLLKAIRLPNRRMKPAAVWLILLIAFNGLFKFLFYFLVYNHIEIFIGFIVFTYLISIFVVVWHFRMVRRIADSIEAEYDSRNIPIEHRPSSQTGTFMGVLMLLNEVHLIGTLGKLIALSFFIVMIAYWVRTYKFKKEIQVMSSHQDEESLIFNDLN